MQYIHISVIKYTTQCIPLLFLVCQYFRADHLELDNYLQCSSQGRNSSLRVWLHVFFLSILGCQLVLPFIVQVLFRQLYYWSFMSITFCHVKKTQYHIICPGLLTLMVIHHHPSRCSLVLGCIGCVVNVLAGARHLTVRSSLQWKVLCRLPREKAVNNYTQL